MKKINQLLLPAILAGNMFMACENGSNNGKSNTNTKREYGEDANIYGDRRDMPTNPEDSTEVDSADLQSDKNEKINSGLPPKVYNAIKNNPSLRDLKVVDFRRFNKENKVYYEVVFRHGEETTSVIYDEQGNDSGDL